MKEETSKTSIDLDQLAAAAQGNASDRGAMQQFLKQIQPFVRHVCRRAIALRPTRQCAFDDEDLAQIVRVKIWTSLSKFDLAKGHFAGWVRKIASCAWIDLAFSRGDTPETVEAGPELQHEGSAVDDQTDARLSLVFLGDSLSPPEMRLIVMNGAGHSAQDIADIEGANVETVKTRIRVARRRAFNCLGAWSTGSCVVAA